MFIFYQNPYFDIIGAICGVAALMAIAGWECQQSTKLIK